MKVSVSIDVPRLDDGLRFYPDGQGLAEIARPVQTYTILKCANAEIGVFGKPAGSKPARGTDDVRRHEWHWTSVHLDFRVDDFEAFLAKAVSAGAICEQKFEVAGRPTIAFRSDPFGNGFCVVGTK